MGFSDEKGCEGFEDIWNQLETGKERRRRLAFEKQCVSCDNTSHVTSQKRVQNRANKARESKDERPLSYAAVTKLAAKQDKEENTTEERESAVHSKTAKNRPTGSKLQKTSTVGAKSAKPPAKLTTQDKESTVQNSEDISNHGVWLNKSEYCDAEQSYYSEKHNKTVTKTTDNSQVKTDGDLDPIVFDGVWVDKAMYTEAETQFYENLARKDQKKSGKNKQKKRDAGGRGVSTDKSSKQCSVQFELDDMYYEDAILPNRQNSVTMMPTAGFMASTLSENLLPEEQLDSLCTEPDMDMGELESGNFSQI